MTLFTFNRFDAILSFDGQTDGRTHDDSIYRASIESRGKKTDVARITKLDINIAQYHS